MSTQAPTERLISSDNVEFSRAKLSISRVSDDGNVMSRRDNFPFLRHFLRERVRSRSLWPLALVFSMESSIVTCSSIDVMRWRRGLFNSVKAPRGELGDVISVTVAATT
jgi:hypothetical protein